MPAEHERPFKQGQVGQVYAACYGEPKTGYQAAKELDIPQNRPYEFKKNTYPELFHDRADNKFLARVEPILDAIIEDFPSEMDLTSREQEELEGFLHTEWRTAYRQAYNTETGFPSQFREKNNHAIIESGPYSTLQFTVGGWHYFTHESPDMHALADDSFEFSKEYDLKPVTEVETDDPHIPLFEAVDELSNTLLTKLSELPQARQMWNFVHAMSSFANFIPIRAVHEPNMIPTAGVELERIEEPDTEKQ